MKNGNDTLEYTYDELGNITSVAKNGTIIEQYTYDALGQLTGATYGGNTYTYGAWGELLSVTGSLASTIGQTNPLRYRGYYYDAETGFYYLNSRYYDPEVGRFISADGQLNNDILGNNLFVYCGNNPIIRADDSGQGWWIVAGAIVGGIVGGAAKAISNIATGAKWNEGIVGAIVGGAVAGAIVAATGGTAWATAGAVFAAYGGVAIDSLTNEALSYTPLAKYNGTSKKETTKENITNSIATVAVDTAVDGTVALITGKIAGKIIPTNNGWFKPQKSASSFVGKYAVKSELQALAQSGLMLGIELIGCSINQYLKQSQQPIVLLFPNM